MRVRTTKNVLSKKNYVILEFGVGFATKLISFFSCLQFHNNIMTVSVSVLPQVGFMGMGVAWPLPISNKKTRRKVDKSAELGVSPFLRGKKDGF